MKTYAGRGVRDYRGFSTWRQVSLNFNSVNFSFCLPNRVYQLHPPSPPLPNFKGVIRGGKALNTIWDPLKKQSLSNHFPLKR